MKKILRPSKPILLGAIVLLCIVVVGSYIWHRTAKKTIQPVGVSSKHFSPPTTEEKAQAETHKDELVQRMNEEKKEQPANTKKAVTPVIANAAQSDAQINVGGFISGVFEDDGTCTATFTQGNLKVVKTSKAFANVSTTQCKPFIIDRSEFSAAGNWQVVLAYNSASSEGVSQATTLAIR